MKRFVTPLLITPLLLTACGGDIAPGHSAKEPQVVTGLTVERVGSATVAAQQSYIGTVESPDRAQIAARIDGRISRIAVREGEQVPAGALLMTIEGNVAANRLAEADGQRQVAAARLKLAEQTESRFRQLRQVEAVTPQEMDRVEAELVQAREGLKAADAAVGQARTTVALTRITAPYAARVVERSVEVGSTVLPGTPLLVLDRIGGWQVHIEVPEAEIARFAIGDALQVEIPSTSRTFSGQVAEIQAAADPTSRSFGVKLQLPADAPLTAGFFARVGHATTSSTTLLVPQTALVVRGQLSGLFVVEQGVLRFRLVKTGRQIGNQVEILSGLTVGENIVTGGADRASSGAKVGG